MSLSGIFNLLQQYAGAGSSSATANTEQDFDSVASNASQSHLAQGLAGAFRSDQTPPFAEMVGSLFSQSNGQQRAGLLNQLLGAAAGGGLGASLPAELGSLLQSGNQVTPQQAEQLSPDAVQQLANGVHQQNPSIVDELSNFYAQHPTLVKSLGAGALALIMSHMSERRS